MRIHGSGKISLPKSVVVLPLTGIVLESLKETIGNAGDTDPLRHPRGLRIYNNMLCIHTFQKRLVSFVSRTGGNLILILKDYGTVEALTLAAITRI